METNFTVKKFLILIAPSGNAIIQNDTGIVDIINRNLVNFISKIDEDKLKTISVNYVKKYFPEDYTHVIDFLLEYKIIEEQKNINFFLDELHFLSNDNNIGGLVDYVLRGQINKNYQYKLTQDILKEISLSLTDKKTLFIAFLNPYSKSEALKIRNKFLNHPNSYLVISYVYHNNLYIDSLYSYDWKSPCHICQINNIENDLTEETDRGINYQKLIDHFYNEYEEFRVGIKLNELQVINVVAQLCNRIVRIIGMDNNLKTTQSFWREGFGMDLKTLKTFTDTTLHWEYCDCYE